MASEPIPPRCGNVAGARHDGSFGAAEVGGNQHTRVPRSVAWEMRFVANLRSLAVVKAFATVPHECFVGSR
jgi:hypothetical protein